MKHVLLVGMLFAAMTTAAYAGPGSTGQGIMVQYQNWPGTLSIQDTMIYVYVEATAAPIKER